MISLLEYCQEYWRGVSKLLHLHTIATGIFISKEVTLVPAWYQILSLLRFPVASDCPSSSQYALDTVMVFGVVSVN